MKILKGLIPLILAASVSLHAQDWPDDPEAVTGFFASPLDGSFSQGLSFAPGNRRILVWSGGEIIWRGGNSSWPTAVGGEELLVLEHNGDFRSVYRGMEFRPNVDNVLAEGEWLGYPGAQGWNLTVADTQNMRLIDPLDLLPTRDSSAVTPVGDVRLRRGEREVNPDDPAGFESGLWDFHMTLTPGAAAPEDISLFWLGQTVASLTRGSLVESGGVLVLETPRPLVYERVYDEAGQLRLRDVMLSPGRGTLELRISDESGRTVSRIWELTFGEVR